MTTPPLPFREAIPSLFTDQATGAHIAISVPAQVALRSDEPLMHNSSDHFGVSSFPKVVPFRDGNYVYPISSKIPDSKGQSRFPFAD